MINSELMLAHWAANKGTYSNIQYFTDAANLKWEYAVQQLYVK